MTHTQYPKRRTVPAPRRHPLVLLGAAAGVAALLGAFAFVGRSGEAAAPVESQIGRSAPAFDELDLVTGQPISMRSLRGKQALLFFSEGVMCQACFVQIQALEERSAELEQRGLVLVNVTNDDEPTAREAIRAYRITTPFIADEDRDMSAAYDVLGQGMHPNMAGHTFVLVDAQGVIRWRRDYWLDPQPTMYVPPDQLLADIPKL